MQHAFNANRGDRGAFNGAEQGTAQRVADGGAEAALKGLGAELAEGVGKRLGIDCQALRFLKSSPKHIVSRFPRGMYVAMHFAAAAQVLLLFEVQ